VVLVDLTVNGSLSLLVLVLEDSLVHNGRSNLFVDCGVMVTSLGPKRWEVSRFPPKRWSQCQNVGVRQKQCETDWKCRFCTNESSEEGSEG